MSIIHHYAQNTSNLSMHNMHNIFPASTSSRFNFKWHSPFRSSRCSLLPSLNGELDEKPWSIQSFTRISRGVVGSLLYSFLHLFSHFEWFESIDELMNYQFLSTPTLIIYNTPSIWWAFRASDFILEQNEGWIYVISYDNLSQPFLVTYDLLRRRR